MRLVVRKEVLLEGGIVGELHDVADKVKHIAAMSRATVSAQDHAPGEPQPGCIYDQRHNEPIVIVDSIYVPNERPALLTAKEFTRFKIQGRGATQAWLMNALFYEILHEGANLLTHEDLKDTDTPMLLLQAFNPESEARLAIPERLL